MPPLPKAPPPVLQPLLPTSTARMPGAILPGAPAPTVAAAAATEPPAPPQPPAVARNASGSSEGSAFSGASEPPTVSHGRSRRGGRGKGGKGGSEKAMAAAAAAAHSKENLLRTFGEPSPHSKENAANWRAARGPMPGHPAQFGQHGHLGAGKVQGRFREGSGKAQFGQHGHLTLQQMMRASH